jgi:Fe-Mn family superoxide dismutase
MPIELPELPYSADALEPHVSENTLNFHYGKHHRGYVNKLNAAIEGTDLASSSLEDIMHSSFRGNDAGVFNNAAQVWNHTFLWHSMSPSGGPVPQGPLAEAVDRDFGGQDAFRDEFAKAATSRFGSGWVWLVVDGDSLSVTSTGNADNPLVHGQYPLLTLDVWEHAYYLDYQNNRGKYVDTFLRELINWDFAVSNYDATRAAA